MEDFVKILELVNVGRAALGKPALSKLPKGEPETTACVLGKALNRRVEYDNFGGVREYYVRCRDEKATRKLAQAWGSRMGDYWHRRVYLGNHDETVWDAGHWEVYLPAILNAFVLRFDTGQIPDLIQTRAIVPADGYGPAIVKAAA